MAAKRKVNRSSIREMVRNVLGRCLTLEGSLCETVAYHGSKADFDQFSMAYIGTGVGAQEFGYGLYLTLDPNAAYGYGGYVYEVEIPDISENKYIFYDRPVRKETIRQIYEELLEINKAENPDDFADESFCQDFMRELEEVMPPTEGRYLMYNIGKYVYDKLQVPMIMRKCGVVGFVYNNGKVNNVVMFDSRQMKITDKYRIGE